MIDRGLVGGDVGRGGHDGEGTGIVLLNNLVSISNKIYAKNFENHF